MKIGLAPILIAIGLVTVLSFSSLTTYLTSSLHNKTRVRQLDRAEGFYQNELVAWHSYTRQADNLALMNESFSISNRYASEIDLIPDSYSTMPGAALNIAATRSYAPALQLFRRYDGNNTTYLSRGTSDYCAASQFRAQAPKTRLCLFQKAAAPNQALKYIYISATRRFFGQEELFDSVYLHRLKPDGQWDLTLGLGGRAQTRAYGSWVIQSDQLGFQSDGKVLVIANAASEGVNRAYISRLQADGTIDTTFNEADFAAHTKDSHNQIYSFVRPDDSFVVLHNTTTYSFARSYLADGRPDATFGASGVAQVSTHPLQASFRLIARPDKKIWALLYDDDGDQLVIRQFTRDGQVDTGFASAGTARHDLGIGVSVLDSMVDVAGLTWLLLSRHDNSPGTTELSVWQLTRNGGLSTPFLNGGQSRWWNVSFHTAALQSDGRIIVLLYSINQPVSVITRYTPDGQRDPTFGQAGQVEFAGMQAGNYRYISTPHKVRVDTQDNIYVMTGGEESPTPDGEYYPITLRKLRSNGDLDRSFGNSGRTSQQILSTSDNSRYLQMDLNY